MISINNVTVSFGGTDLFSSISFMINKRDRIGLVGRNGAGKSTLLKVILGERVPDGGMVAIPSEVTLGYLPQQMKVHDTRSVFEETLSAFEHLKALEKEVEDLTSEIGSRDDYESDDYAKLCARLSDANEHYHLLGGGNQDGEAEMALLGLGFKREEFERPTSTFSGGWRMRIELAKLLLRRPSVLLLDEPTNHLDIESIQWLETYLKDYPGALVLISHDRVFLDNVTDRTIEISLGKVYDYKTSYSHYVELRKERREQQLAAYTNQQKQIADTEDFIERFRYKATKSNQVQSRIKQLEKLDIIEVDEEDNSRLNIKFPPAPRSGQVVIEAKELGKSFGEKHVFSGANIVVERGEKVALVGRNGEGKSTFAKILMGEHPHTEGEYKLGHNVNIGYFAQNEADIMDGNITVYDTLEHVAVGDIRTRLRDILGAFLFRGEEVDKKVMVLSGGERSRLAMARLMLEPHNLLILDEPTNHMDIESIQWLEEFLINSAKAVIVISHDRAFVDNITTRTIEVTMGRIYDYKVNYSKYLELRKERREQQQKQYDDQQKMIADNMEFIERFKGTYSKTLQVQSRVKMLEKLELVEIDEEDTSSLRLKFPPSPRAGSYPVIADGVGKTYGNHVVFQNASFTIERGERVAFVGKNGEGKSTMVKSIMKEIEHDGTLTIGHNVQIGYFAQNQA